MSNFLDKISIRFLLKFAAILIVFLQVFNNIFIYFVVDDANSKIDNIEVQAKEMALFNNISNELGYISSNMYKSLIMNKAGEKKLKIEEALQKTKDLKNDTATVAKYLSQEESELVLKEVDEYLSIVNGITNLIMNGQKEKARLNLLNKAAKKEQVILNHLVKIEEELLKSESEGLQSMKDLLLFQEFVILALLVITAIISFIMYKIASQVGKRFNNNINELTTASTQLDLTARLHAKGSNELAVFSSNFNHYAKNIHGAMSVASSSSSVVSVASQQLAASTEQLKEALGQQSNQISEITSAMNQASETVVDVTQRIQGIETNVSTIASTVGVTSSNMDKLKEESTAINSIVETIQGISEQVNLLALNAAIEAARAGDAGRGFAVVADEVRKLASQTNESTEEIRTAVSSLQSNVDDSYTSLIEITNSVNEISGEVESVAAASTEQSSTIEEISATVVSFADMISQNEEATKQAGDATISLKEEAQKLDGELQKFVL